MSEYTEGDFKNAKFARHPDGRIAMRAEPETSVPWHKSDDWFKRLDVAMARDGWRPVHESAPLTLDALREAWENAEQAGECRKGDVLIRRQDYGAYKVYPAARDGEIWTARILHRAPQPEPWQALADVLRTTGVDGQAMDPEILADVLRTTGVDGQAMDPEILASVLHERGVRVTGGDET